MINTSLKDMSPHDKTVYRVAVRELRKEGTEIVKVGAGVTDRLSICSKLKRQFPKSQIITYFDGTKIEFKSPQSIKMSGLGG